MNEEMLQSKKEAGKRNHEYSSAPLTSLIPQSCGGENKFIRRIIDRCLHEACMLNSH